MSEELPPIWALTKASEAAGYGSWRESKIGYHEGSSVYRSIIAHARTIAQYEQPPVDEDEESLKRIIGKLLDDKPSFLATVVQDNRFPAALAQFKRELEARK